MRCGRGQGGSGDGETAAGGGGDGYGRRDRGGRAGRGRPGGLRFPYVSGGGGGGRWGLRCGIGEGGGEGHGGDRGGCEVSSGVPLGVRGWGGAGRSCPGHEVLPRGAGCLGGGGAAAALLCDGLQRGPAPVRPGEVWEAAGERRGFGAWGRRAASIPVPRTLSVSREQRPHGQRGPRVSQRSVPSPGAALSGEQTQPVSRELPPIPAVLLFPVFCTGGELLLKFRAYFAGSARDSTWPMSR